MVTAPISGRIGPVLVTEGALVGEGEATHLATIQQLDPIYADINQRVSDHLQLKAAISKALKNEEKAEVTLSLDRDETDFTYSELNQLADLFRNNIQRLHAGVEREKRFQQHPAMNYVRQSPL